MNGNTLTYRIDANDVIVHVGEEWTAFANTNAGHHLGANEPLSRFISDPTTIQIYTSLLARLRAGASPVRFPLRCDAPTMRRLLEMRVSAEDGDVTFETRVVHSQVRPGVAALDPDVPRSRSQLKLCSWCSRMLDAEGQWVELEDGLAAMRLFEARVLPLLSHGMCPRCYDAMVSTVADMRLGSMPIRDSTRKR